MTKLIGTLAASAAMVLAPALAFAQDASEWQTEPPPQTAQPEEAPPAPSELPPAPQYQAQQPQYQEQQPQAQASVPPGQWVYTQQYGWIWMPYADAYTRVPSDGYGAPYAYVYAPAYSCWTWLAAPWVWGIGPWPVFGAYGPVYFAWYGHGWWRYPSHWHYAPAPAYAGYGYRGGYRGGWPVPNHAGYGSYRGAPVPNRAGHGSFRGAPAPAPRSGGAAFFGRGGGGGQAFARPQVANGGRGFAGGAFGGGRPGGGAGGGRSGGGRAGGGHGHR